MSNTSRDYAKFKREFVGPVLTRKQRIALMPSMPAIKPVHGYKPFATGPTYLIEPKSCALPGCDNAVTNWRLACCCNTHQRQYSAKCATGTEKLPLKTTDEIRAYHRKWAIEKQQRVARATPSWADKSAIKEIYLLAAKLTVSTGIIHEVDHIVPLTSKIVCGLHTEANLQILTMQDNRAKSNKF